MKPEEAARVCETIINQVKKVIVGKDLVLEKVMLAILSDSHILFEDYPGLAKTLLARSFAASMGCAFSRIQFTPDRKHGLRILPDPVHPRPATG